MDIYAHFDSERQMLKRWVDRMRYPVPRPVRVEIERALLLGEQGFPDPRRGLRQFIESCDCLTLGAMRAIIAITSAERQQEMLLLMVDGYDRIFPVKYLADLLNLSQISKARREGIARAYNKNRSAATFSFEDTKTIAPLFGKRKCRGQICRENIY